MPARSRIVALVATLAFAVPASALAQSGGGGAGDSQCQDPFGSQSQSSKPSKPAQQAPAPPRRPSQSDPAPTLPRTGFDVLPVAALGLLLLLGGLALWRRPHAGN